MSFHHAEDIEFFPVVQNHCKQVLKQLNDTQLDFVLLSCEDDDESFNLITCQRALAILAFEQGDTETLAKIPTVIRKCNDHRNASILMNDLGVMLSLKAVYQRSEDCFFIANNYFELTEDHLNSAIVTFNLAALYIIQGEYQKAFHFSDLAANLCHDITMRTTNDANLPMKVLKRAADILKELGNLKKFRNILRISIKFDIGGKDACEVDASKWLIKVQLREEEGGKIEGKELDELNSHLFTLINALDAQSLTADFVRTVLTAARVNYRNGLVENAFRLLEMLEHALLMSSGRKDPLYGWLLFQIGQFKLGCGMISDAEKSLKQAELILMKCQGRNYHLLAHCKKLIGSCALLNNNLEGAFTNLNDAFTFFSDINSQHFELADISLKLSQLQIEKGNFQDAKEILWSSLVKHTDSCGEISPKTASGYVQAGLILQKVDKEAAIDKVTQAIDILHRLGFPFHHPEVKLCQRLIGLLQLSLGKKQEAEISVSKETLEIDKKLHLNAKCLVNEGSTTEASALDCSSEVTLRPTSSSFPLQNQEFPPVRCVDVCLCLLDSMLRSRSTDYKQKSLNFAPPFSLVFSSVDISSLQGNLSFLSSESVPSLSSFPESPGTDIQHPPVFRKELPPLSFPPGCDGPLEQFLNEPHVCSNGDNIDAHLSKPGTREETEDEDHCTEVLHWITESNVSENPVNFDSTDGVIRQKDEHVKADVPCIEVNKCSPVQMVANHCTSDQNLSQEIHSPVTQGIERRALWKRIFHPVIMKKEEESVPSQSCHSFKLQEEVKTLKDQLRESKAEIQQLKAELGRYLFLEDREKRSRKLQLVPRPPTSDESRQYAASVSCNETSLDRRLLVQGASFKRQPGEQVETSVLCAEANEWYPVQMVANHCASDQNLSHEIHSPVTQGIERRAVEKSRFHPVVMKKEEESAASQNCYSFELQEEVKKLKEQLRESEVEIRQLKAELGRYLFLEDKEKRSGKLQLLPRGPTSDESRQYAASSSSNETSLDERLLVEETSLETQPGPSLRTIYIDISNSLSAAEFQRMKDLAKGKVSDLKLARMRVPYQLLVELERVSDHPRTDIRELLESIQRLDLRKKLGVSLDAGIAAVSPGFSPLKDESLNLLSAEDEETRRSRTSARSSALSGGENGERISGNQDDNSYASFLSFESSAENEREIPASRDTEDYEGLPLESVRTDGKEDTGVSFSSDEAGPSSILSSTSSNSSDSFVLNFADQPIEGSREPDAANSSNKKWELQGARPKRTQTQRPVDLPLRPSSSPVSDGLAKDFLARHSQDRAIQESLYRDDRDLPSFDPERLRNHSFVDGLTSALEAYSARSYFGTMGASLHERLGGAFSELPSSGSADRAGLLGSTLNNESSYSGSTHTTAAPLPSFTGQTHFSSVWNRMSSDGVHTINRLLPPNEFATSHQSLTGGQDFSREWDYLLNQNFRGSRLSLQQINTLILPNPRFVYGSTSWDFAAGIHPGYSMYGAQRHVLSNGSAALIDDQRSYNGNLNLESQSSQCGEREPVQGSFDASGVADSLGIQLPFMVPCTKVVSNSTNRSSVAVYGIEETSLLPVSSEVNSEDTWSNRDYGRNTVEPNDNLLPASEQRTTKDASALLPEREEREEFLRELQRKEQMIREERERERREKEDREWQEAEKWPPQQEGVSTGSRWLCEHHQRRCTVRFPCCGQFYPCDLCHNSSSNCKNDEAKACHATHLKCSLCHFEQEIDENSDVCSGCGEKMAAYFCSICKHFTSFDKNPYHCDQCGICRIHKDKSFHCEVCNVCLDKRLENNHKCRPDSGCDECCICLEDTFSGCQILPCSHKVHRECAIAMIQSGIRTCPVCRHPLYTPLNE